MKINISWKAIQNFFKMDPATLDSQELTDERVQQINDQLATVTARNEELESLLEEEKSAHAKTLADFEALKNEDAASETVARKAADKISGGEQDVVFSHDRVADSFLS